MGPPSYPAYRTTKRKPPSSRLRTTPVLLLPRPGTHREGLSRTPPTLQEGSAMCRPTAPPALRTALPVWSGERKMADHRGKTTAHGLKVRHAPSRIARYIGGRCL